MQPIPATQDQRARISKMLMALFDYWQLPDTQSLALLGLSPSNRAALSRYRRGSALANDRDKLDRAGSLLGIHKTLRLLFPRNRELAYAWMTTPNRAFGGQTPAEYAIKGGLLGLYTVRAYLDRQRGH